MTPSEPTFIPAWKGAHPQDCDYYAWWVNALTEQGLHAKTDIAMALGIMSEHIDILETQLRTRSAVETADIRRQLAEATCKECGAVSGDHVEGCSALKASAPPFAGIDPGYVSQDRFENQDK
jgi:hypothetical protein